MLTPARTQGGAGLGASGGSTPPGQSTSRAREPPSVPPPSGISLTEPTATGRPALVAARAAASASYSSPSVARPATAGPNFSSMPPVPQPASSTGPAAGEPATARTRSGAPAPRSPRYHHIRPSTPRIP